MGNFFQAIGDFFSGVLGAVVSFFGSVLEFFSESILAPIMNFLGFHDETVVDTSIIAAKIYDEDTFVSTQLKEALRYMKNDAVDAIMYAKDFATVGDKQYGLFYRHGKWDYTDYLPDAQVNATTTDKGTIESVLKRLKGNLTILEILPMVPTDEDWCKYWLQENHGYDVGSDQMFWDTNKYFKFDKVQYQAHSNTFKITMAAITPIKEITYHITRMGKYTRKVNRTDYNRIETRVIASDATKDTIEETTFSYYVLEYLNDTTRTSEETEVDTVTYEVDKGTVSDSDVTTVVSTEIAEAIVQEEVILETILYSRTDTGSSLYKSTPVIIEELYEILPDEGMVSSSETIEVVSERLISNTQSKLEFTNVPAHNNQVQYTVKYILESNSQVYLWIYDPLTGQYPTIGTPLAKVIGFDMYPVVLLRNMFWDIVNYDVWGNKPPTLTEDRYNSTKDLLNRIGLDIADLTEAYGSNPNIGQVQDGFFIFGISPSNDKPIVSKVLFELFDFIYDRLPPVEDSEGYSAGFQENPYNAGIVWTPMLVEIQHGDIGTLGTCTHSIDSGYYLTKVYEVLDVTGSEMKYDNYGNPIGAYRVVTKYQRTDKYDSAWNLLGTTTTTPETFTVRSEDHDNFYVYVLKDESYEIEERYPLGHKETMIDSQRVDFKDLVMKKQIENSRVKQLIARNMKSFNIIRRGVDNGGVLLEIDNENLVIPLPVDIVSRLTIMQKTALLGESAYLMFYTYEEHVIKWYQTAAFAGFLQVVGIAITVVVSIMSFGSAAPAAATLTTILYNVLQSVAIGVALQLALKLIASVVDDVGLKIALSVAAMAVAAWAGGSFSGDFDFTCITKLAEMPVKAIEICAQDTNKQILDIYSKMQEFSAAYQAQSEEFDDIIKGFNTGLTAMDYADLMEEFSSSSANAFVMSPSQFYSMSIDACKDVSSTIQGLFDSIHYFVDNSLRIGVQDGMA